MKLKNPDLARCPNQLLEYAGKFSKRPLISRDFITFLEALTSYSMDTVGGQLSSFSNGLCETLEDFDCALPVDASICDTDSFLET